MKRIFVQIVSYRDPECHHTIADLFKKAAHPERIHVGVCWQADPQQDAEFLAVPYPRAEQVKIAQFHMKDAQGAGWARNEAQKLWNGEEYVLQVQAHMRFEPNWDMTLIETLEGLPENAVLTAWLPNYKPPSRKEPLNGDFPIATVNRLGGEEDAQIIHLIRRMVREDVYDAPFLTGMWVGNFLFARAEVVNRIPSDPHIYFWGEELNLSARLWTHGYDIYHLHKVVLYHYWDRKEVRDESLYRDHRAERNARSLARNRHVLGLAVTDDKEALADIGKYGLGDKRSIADYWRFLGVDLKAGTIRDFARLGEFGGEQHPTIFVQIASFRDPETQHTVADLFAKAKYPQRITVGICHQLHPTDDAHCIFTPRYPMQVAITTLDHRDSQGANWARAEAMQHYAGEDYVLQIDAHMRFEAEWDEALIEMVTRAPQQPAAITAYLHNYDPPDVMATSPGHLMRMVVRKLGDENEAQLVHITGEYVPEDGTLAPTPFVVANFYFAPKAVWQQVPVDPHIFFHGDELSLAARLWTHGVNLYQPDRLVAYHYWVRTGELKKHSYRRLGDPRAAATRARIQHLLAVEKTDNTAVLADLERFGLGNARPLSEFWDYSGVDLAARTVSEKALKGKWDTMATTGKQSKAGGRPRIFVQIASYRDPECQRTIKDMFEKATHPERIFVGICWQFVKEEDAVCFSEPYPRADQVRIIEKDARQGKGVCWARSLTQTLWEGEEYTLQIDSHMRFEPGWDETLLRMLDECNNPRAVLTCYPPGFTPPDKVQSDWFFGMSAKEFDANGIFKMTGKPAYRPGKGPDKPMKGAFASACMFFGPSSIIKDVPYDPHLYFFGEEISLAVRLWTHGYDLYHPNAPVIYHDWDRNKRPTHFKDHGQESARQNHQSYVRVKHLLGTELTNDAGALVDIEKYGFGTTRTLAQYERYSGVNFRNKTFTENAANGIFDESAAPERSSKDARIFVRIAAYRDPETQHTVADLFAKANYPDRIKVGICWQFDEVEDVHCFEVVTRPEQVQVIPYDWRESDGVCWARAQTEMLLEYEEYTLQIDSHTRFAPGWDEALIDELNACPSNKAILSSSPARYTPPNDLEKDPLPTVRHVLQFSASGNIRGQGELLEREPPVPLKGAFIAAGFVFSRSDLVREVPYDPYLYFDQEEILYALRAYTYGWDVFSPRRQYLYHYYNDPEESVRPLHWNDLKQNHEEKRRFLSARGLARFNHLTGFKSSHDARTLAEIDKYGFGHVRTLAQFEEYTGIDFRKKVASVKALTCGFITDLAKYRSQPIDIVGVGTPKKQRGAFEAGDILPYFTTVDTNGKTVSLEMAAGRPSLLFFLPFTDPEKIAPFFKALHEKQKALGRLACGLYFVLDAPIEKLTYFREKTRMPHVLWADADRTIAKALGVGGRETAFLLSANLQVKKKYEDMAGDALARSAIDDMVALLADAKPAGDTVSETAPILVLNDIFPATLCDELVAAFRAGDRFKGESAKGYTPDSKLREDMIVSEELRAKIDHKLSKSLFPEIEKIFGFKVTARENYKIGLYSGEQEGFFARHRDNFEPELGYRRIAMTLHLSDDYTGGGLTFPEYDTRTYRPGKGGVVAFPSGLLHEAHKVTKGERFVLVGFFHGAEEEAFRQDHARENQKPLHSEEFIPVVQDLSGLVQSRDFYRRWKETHKPTVHDTREVILTPANSFEKQMAFAVGREKHRPVKVSESRGSVVYDNFLPPALYEQMKNFCHTTDYEHINTKGKVSRAWHVHDGFPLRSINNSFYYREGTVPAPKPHYVYPTSQGFDPFLEYMFEFHAQVEAYVGKPADNGWEHFSATSWLYPPGTGLSMHDDGSGVYTGAYAFFLNDVWRAHWGGMLMVMDDAANDAIHAHRATTDQLQYHQKKWLHANNMDELMTENGLARAVFPKGNRIAFIAPDAYHMVSRVNEPAGDNIRVSIAGFFNRKKKRP